MADVIETTATEVNQVATPATPPVEETAEQKIQRVTAEVNDYLMKQGLQLQVEHRCIIVPTKIAQ